MIQSDEPGYYETGKFGIRLETDIEVVAADTPVSPRSWPQVRNTETDQSWIWNQSTTTWIEHIWPSPRWPGSLSRPTWLIHASWPTLRWVEMTIQVRGWSSLNETALLIPTRLTGWTSTTKWHARRSAHSCKKTRTSTSTFWPRPRHSSTCIKFPDALSDPAQTPTRLQSSASLPWLARHWLCESCSTNLREKFYLYIINLNNRSHSSINIPSQWLIKQ